MGEGDSKKMQKLVLNRNISNQKATRSIAILPWFVAKNLGFAIRVDRGTNTKGGFDKKVSEGLTFLREFVDPAACILPNGKDKRLGPIKTKSDLPKYQLTMRNYFNIPNQMAFTNVNQDNGRVIKGSRGHLAKFSGGGVENQAECLKFWRKNSRAPAGT